MTVLEMSADQSPGQLTCETRMDQAPEPGRPEQASGTTAFLQRSEALRLRQECVRDLDMRKCVSEPCKRYRYRRRTFWLDAQSHELFEEQLKRDGGVFTVAAYETIFDAANAGSERVQPNASQCTGSAAGKRAAEHQGDGSGVRQLHEILKLGHYENRRKGRLKYSTRVLLRGNGPLLPGRTRDISETGLQIRVPFLGGCQVGDAVKVTFPDHVETKRSEMPFRVMRVVQKPDEFIVALGWEEGIDTRSTIFLRGLIEGIRGGDKVRLPDDVESAALTAQSILANRHYMRATALIPFFLVGKEMQSAQVKGVAHNEGNRQTLFSYKAEAGSNALADAINRRHLYHFRKLAKVDGQILATLAVWRPSDGGGLVTLIDMACRTDSDWFASLAQHRQSEDFRAFRVIVRKAGKPNAGFLRRELAPLTAKSAALAKRMLTDSDQVIAVGALLDVTSEVRAWNLTPYESVRAEEPREEVEDRLYRAARNTKPIRVQYIDNTRSHSRCLLRLDVKLEMLGKSIPAVTGDISRSSISVLPSEDVPPVTSGTPARVTFSGLEEQTGIVSRLQRTLEAVSYQVVWSDYSEGHLLRLRLQDPERQRGFIRVLDAFLNKHQSALRAEKAHAFQAAASRLYSALFVETSVTIPMLYFGSTASGSPLVKIGVTRTPSPLVAFFEIADGRLDFSALTASDRTTRLWEEVVRHGRAEMTVFLVKERVPGEPWYRISSMADFEFSDQSERREFVEHMLGKDARIIKIILLPARAPADAELAQVLAPLEQHSIGRAAKLSEEFNNVIAIGDVVDVTSTSNEVRYLASDQVVPNREIHEPVEQ